MLAVTGAMGLQRPVLASSVVAEIQNQQEREEGSTQDVFSSLCLGCMCRLVSKVRSTAKQHVGGAATRAWSRDWGVLALLGASALTVYHKKEVNLK